MILKEQNSRYYASVVVDQKEWDAHIPPRRTEFEVVLNGPGHNKAVKRINRALSQRGIDYKTSSRQLDFDLSK